MEVKPNIIKTEAEKIIANHKENTANEFIKTPNSLRLDSKKYSEEAHNFKLRLEAKNPDYLVVIAYGKIIPQYILDIAQIAPINVHGSLLPKYRGASPLQSVFLNQERQTGITIMKMDANMDTGNMIDMLKFDIEFNWTVKDLIEKIMQK
jgi:methionyl-tRNA formyltransferase